MEEYQQMCLMTLIESVFRNYSLGYEIKLQLTITQTH